MIALRPYLNGDSPRLVALWNEQPPQRGRFQPLTVGFLEQFVLSRPDFDPAGMLLAERAGRVVGMVHAGFPLSDRVGEVNRREGMICQLLLPPGEGDAEVASRLLAGAEQYLRERGVEQILAGAVGYCSPFYLGLYGGSRLPGILEGDLRATSALTARGYREHRRIAIWQRELTGFRPPVDRELMSLRRQLQWRLVDDYTSTKWCENCALAWTEPVCLQATLSGPPPGTAQLLFWDMAPLANAWGGRSLGLISLDAHLPSRPGASVTCILAEAMRHFQSEGVGLLEVQSESGDAVLQPALEVLKFKVVEYGVQFRLEGEQPLQTGESRHTGQ